MNIIITGGSGFIGQNIIPILLKNGHTITLILRDFDRVKDFSWHSDVDYIELDISATDLSLPASIISSQDTLLHLAWPSLNNYHSLSHIESALPASYFFLKQMVELGIPRILVTGTCLEYGNQSGPLLPSAPTFPNTSYGIAKDSLRKYLELLQKDHHFVLQWLRLFYLYGPGQRTSSLLSSLDQAIKTNQPIFDMSEGEQLRDYLHVTDACKQIAAILETSAINETGNICSGIPISVRKLVENRIKEQGSSIKLNLGAYPYPEYEPMAFWGTTIKPEIQTSYTNNEFLK